jgi:hypothetical protein
MSRNIGVNGRHDTVVSFGTFLIQAPMVPTREAWVTRSELLGWQLKYLRGRVLTPRSTERILPCLCDFLDCPPSQEIHERDPQVRISGSERRESLPGVSLKTTGALGKGLVEAFAYFGPVSTDFYHSVDGES